MNEVDNIAKAAVECIFNSIAELKASLMCEARCLSAILQREKEYNDELMRSFFNCLLCSGGDCNGDVPQNSYPGEAGRFSVRVQVDRRNIAMVIKALAPLVRSRQAEVLTEEERNACLDMVDAYIRAIRNQRSCD